MNREPTDQELEETIRKEINLALDKLFEEGYNTLKG